MTIEYRDYIRLSERTPFGCTRKPTSSKCYVEDIDLSLQPGLGDLSRQREGEAMWDPRKDFFGHHNPRVSKYLGIREALTPELITRGDSYVRGSVCFIGLRNQHGNKRVLHVSVTRVISYAEQSQRPETSGASVELFQTHP